MLHSLLWLLVVILLIWFIISIVGQLAVYSGISGFILAVILVMILLWVL